MISKSKNNNPFLFCKFLVGVCKYKMYTHTPFYRCHIYNQPKYSKFTIWQVGNLWSSLSVLLKTQLFLLHIQHYFSFPQLFINRLFPDAGEGIGVGSEYFFIITLHKTLTLWRWGLTKSPILLFEYYDYDLISTEHIAIV